MPARPPLRYDFEISHTPEGLRIRSADHQMLALSMWSRNTRDPGHMIGVLMRHSCIKTRMNRGLTPKRAACVIEGTSLRCFVFTV